jgi:hypothetical protein
MFYMQNCNRLPAFPEGLTRFEILAAPSICCGWL